MSPPIPKEYTVALGGTWSEHSGHDPYPSEGRPPRVSKAHVLCWGGVYPPMLLLPPLGLKLLLIALLAQMLQSVQSVAGGEELQLAGGGEGHLSCTEGRKGTG